jgi:prepilin peptidase CpaA
VSLPSSKKEKLSTMVFYGILVSLLLIACVTDIRSQRIPNWLTCSSVVAAMVYHGGAEGLPGLMPGIEGLALGIAFLLPFYMAGGMGAGDVKLMGAVGALLGPKGVCTAFLCTAIAGGVYALVLLAARSRPKDAILQYGTMRGLFYCAGTMAHARRAAGDKPVLRYAVAIAAGTLFSCARGLLW